MSIKHAHHHLTKEITMASYNQGKEQNHNGGAGKYTANGFVPSRTSNSDNTSDNSGCFGMVILFILGASTLVYGIISVVV